MATLEHRRPLGVLRRESDPATGRHRFFHDGREIGLAEWNRLINQANPMELKSRHPLWPVRWLEGRRRRKVLRLAAGEAFRRCLDVGCEAGHFTRALAGSGALAVGIDLDRRVLARSRDAGPVRGGYLAAASAEALPFPDASFDFVLCAETLEHVGDPAGAVGEIFRVTRPGGRFLLAVPNDRLVVGAKRLLHRLGLGRLLGGLSPGLAMGHLRVFDPASLAALCPAGARVERVGRDAPFFLNLYLLARRIG